MAFMRWHLMRYCIFPLNPRYMSLERSFLNDGGQIIFGYMYTHGDRNVDFSTQFIYFACIRRRNHHFVYMKNFQFSVTHCTVSLLSLCCCHYMPQRPSIFHIFMSLSHMIETRLLNIIKLNVSKCVRHIFAFKLIYAEEGKGSLFYGNTPKWWLKPKQYSVVFLQIENFSLVFHKLAFIFVNFLLTNSIKFNLKKIQKVKALL